MAEPGMVIVGAGKAAARAVVGLREFGWQGPITLIGEEHHLPYDRPPLSKAQMLEEGEQSPVLLVDDSVLKSLGVTFLRNARVGKLDRGANEALLTDGSRIPYKKLLICTGSGARKLNLPGAERALILRNFEDTLTLRKVLMPGVSVAIIGGGFIGLELASSAVKRGCAVTVIEALPRVLLRAVPEEIAQVVANRHVAEGVTLICNARIEKIESGAVLLQDGACVPAEILIAGIGSAPAIQIGEVSGLAMDNGIACNDHMQTSDPDIYAAGDCCSFPHPLHGGKRMRLEAWRAAQDQASVATENMCGGDKVYEAVPWFWSDQYDLSLQIAGVPGEGTKSVRRPLKDDAFIIMNLADDGRIVGASGIGRGNAVARDIKLAEMLIARRAKPEPAALADPGVQLKALLKA